MNLRSARLRGLMILVLVGGGFIWLAVQNLDVAVSELGLQLLLVSAMVVLLMVLAFLAAVALRKIIQYWNQKK